MATLVLDHLEKADLALLEELAAANRRSVEAEARERLAKSLEDVRKRQSLVDRFRAVRIDPGPGYEGSVALIRAIRDEE